MELFVPNFILQVGYESFQRLIKSRLSRSRSNPGVDMDIAGCSVRIRIDPQSFQKSPVKYIAKLQSAVAQLIQLCLENVHR